MIKLIPWVGGKAQLMWAIQMLLPTYYKTLVDVFGGSGIITLNTSVPKGCLQIYNDLNHDLYNLFFCVKHRPSRPQWLRQDLRPAAVREALPRGLHRVRRHHEQPRPCGGD